MSARAFCPPPLTVTMNRSVVWKSSNYLRGRSEALNSSTCAAGKPAVCRCDHVILLQQTQLPTCTSFRFLQSWLFLLLATVSLKWAEKKLMWLKISAKNFTGWKLAEVLSEVWMKFVPPFILCSAGDYQKTSIWRLMCSRGHFKNNQRKAKGSTRTTEELNVRICHSMEFDKVITDPSTVNSF